MSREFLGSGWSFPVRSREDGAGVGLSAQEANIAESIQIVLNTQPGERQMLPEFGCPLQDLIFANNSAATRHRAESMVRAALSRWEPRIDVDSVRAERDPAKQNQVRLFIEYTVRKSNNHQNLVHLVQLQEFFNAD